MGFLNKFKVEAATRVQKKVKALISGPTNAGKTMGALLIAKGLTNAGKVLVVDSENGRSSLHVGDGELDGWQWDAVYIGPEEATTNNLIAAIEEAEKAGYQALILDSITHEWEHIKDYQQQLGGRFTDWKKPKELHNKFVRKVLGSNIHIIMTMRSKMDYVQSIDDNGKKAVMKLGLNPQGESNFPYEVDFHFAVNEDHLARMDKTAQSLFTDPELFHITQETGNALRRFSEEGEKPEDRQKKVFVARIRELASGMEKPPELPPEDELMKKTLDELTDLGKELAQKAK
jgi:hypothetical protein